MWPTWLVLPWVGNCVSTFGLLSSFAPFARTLFLYCVLHAGPILTSLEGEARLCNFVLRRVLAPPRCRGSFLSRLF